MSVKSGGDGMSVKSGGDDMSVKGGGDDMRVKVAEMTCQLKWRRWHAS